MGDASDAALANPIINRPYDIPDRHFDIGPSGPTGETKPGRRPSESWVPVPKTRKGQEAQLAMDLDVTRERREPLSSAP